MSQYFKIGKFAASHGLLGELILQHSLGKKTTLKGLEALFIEEIIFENVRLIDILPQLEIIAKYNGLKLNRAKDFTTARRLSIKSLYLN